MSNEDRMDRAKRIREMREGGRDGPESDDDGPAEHSDTDSAPTEADAATETADQSDAEPVETDADQSGVAGNGAGTETVQGAVPDEDASGGLNAPIPESDQLEAALDETDADADAEAVGPGIEEEAEDAEEEETRVLEFTLDDEYYCLNIEYIEEIVKQETITRVPNTPKFVEGVVDLRGQITTILNPKVTIDKENSEAGELIVVFDEEAFEDQGYIGWVVDDVRQVSPITESDVNEPPMQEDYINGVIDREDREEFVIWTTPELTFQDES
jgi:purine-binding chemotaxis protein CheW